MSTMNERVKSSMHRFAAAAIAVLQRQSALTPIRFWQREVVEFSDDGTPVHRVVARPLWHELVDNARPSLQQLPETSELTAELLQESSFILPRMSNDPGQAVAPSSDDLRRHVWEKLVALLVRYLSRSQQIRFDDDTFSEIMDQCLAFWCATEAEHSVHVPLIGVVGDPVTIDIEDQLRICPLPAALKSELWDGPARSSWGVDARELSACRFQVEGKYRSKPMESDNRVDLAADTVVLALRLLQPGTVVPMGSFHRSGPVELGGSTGAGVQGNWRPIPRERTPYALAAHVTGHVRSLYRQLGDGFREGRYVDLDVCRSRFEQAYLRDSPEDKVIDLTIALESALLPDVKDELSYRIAVRGAALLRRRRPARETYQLLRALYDARSKIVHSGKRLKAIARAGHVAGLPIPDFISAAQDVVRQTLMELFEALPQRRLKEVVNALDEELIMRMEADGPTPNHGPEPGSTAEQKCP